MNKKLVRFIVICAMCGFSGLAYGIVQKSITVGLTGMENDGSNVYVGIAPNPNACLYGGIYFIEAAEIDKVLSVALAAKLAGKTVRIDYNQPGGPGRQCFGYGIYVE